MTVCRLSTDNTPPDLRAGINKYITRYNKRESMTDSQAGERSNHDELVEVIKAFLDKYRGPTAGPGKTRVQKLVFFGELYALHEYGYRLTDAEFRPYLHGSYAEEISDILDEADGIEEFESQYSRSTQYRNSQPPRISAEKLKIVDEIWQTTKEMSDEALEFSSKGSWLYENTEFDTPMDFEEYANQLVSPSKWRSLDLEETDPVGSDAETIDELVE